MASELLMSGWGGWAIRMDDDDDDAPEAEAVPGVGVAWL